MILSLTKIVGGIPFSAAINLSRSDEHRYIRCSGLPKNTYIQVNENTLGNVSCRYVEISENCDILSEQEWTNQISVNAVLNTNWSVYKATIG